MKLLTKALEAKLPALGTTDGTPTDEQKIVVKFFTPDSNWTWYATEGTRDEDGDMRFFGLVDGFEQEWGYFMLSELEQNRGPLGLHIERDKWFDGYTIGKLKQQGLIH